MREQNGKKESDISEEYAKPRRGKTFLRLLVRFGILVATVALVLGAVYLVAHRDTLNLDTLRRAFSYSGVEKDANGQTEHFRYDGDPGNSFATLDGGLLVCSNHSIQLFDKSGTLTVDQAVNLEQPVVATAGDYAVVYDVGGGSLYLLQGQELVRSYETPSGGAIYGADVTADGWLVIVEEATGYKAAATVYNAEFSPVVTENISSVFVTGAALSADHKTLALATMRQSGQEFESAVQFYTVSNGELQGTCSMGSDLVLDMRWSGKRLWIQGEYGVYCVENGEVRHGWTDTNRYLEGFSLDGSGFAASYTSRFRGTGAGTLCVYTEDGEQYEQSLTEEVLSVSAGGHYVAVLTATALTIYDEELSQVYATLDNLSGARRVLMRADGSAMLIATENASLFVPN